MKNISILLIKVALILCIPLGMAVAQTGTAPAPNTPPPPAGGDPWPRSVVYQGATLNVYQPQLDTWKGNVLEAYAAVTVLTPGKQDKDYGVIWFTAQTEVDKVNRVVTLDDFKITKQKFPTVPDNGAAYAHALQVDLPWRQTIPLDELETSLVVAGAAAQQKTYKLQNNPPVIFFSTTPAFLALIDGQPVLQPTGAKNIQKVINTRALMLFDFSKSMYYLALMDGWVEAQSALGPYSLAQHPPAKELDQIKQAALTNSQNQVLGGPEQSLKETYEEGEAPTVYVSTAPAELLQTQGQPLYDPVYGTSLVYVSNSGNDIFLDNANNEYYILVAGRWFESLSLQNGPWTYVSGTSLPAGFAQIPPYSPKASILVSVPGTPQAKEALIANQIPQTATITRSAAKLTVTYSGAPIFQPVEGTDLTYAVNTPTPVIDVPSNTYYAVQNAVWFVSPAPTGPWTVATSVPGIIYTIPPSCPIHYVTYVQVYGFTPSVVYVGYTPGYYGTVVSSDNVVVYGTGWYYPPYVTTTTWVPAPYTYGVGAAFSWSPLAGWGLGFGLGMAVGAACSPWWGPVGGWSWGYAAPAWGWGGYGGAAAANTYGHWGNTAYGATHAAWANPYTGNIGAGSRGSYYNPVTGATGVGERGANYNAYTGNYEAGGRAAGYNPTTGTAYAGGHGTVGNAYTGNYASGAHGATYDANTGVVKGGAAGTVGNAYTGASSSVNRGYTYNTKTGNGVGYSNNNMYADHDGNVYKYNPTSGFQQHTGSGWTSSSPNLDSSKSSLGGWQNSRSEGAQRWGNFSSGGWGGHWGGGGWADRGGGDFRGGGFGGFRR
jgi:hypothetical protein